jgi:hypothetical protein
LSLIRIALFLHTFQKADVGWDSRITRAWLI